MMSITELPQILPRTRVEQQSLTDDDHDDVNEEQLMDIGQQLRTTFNHLNSYSAEKQEHDILSNTLKDAAQRFDLWAVNLGLYVTGHSSLEYRLGDAPLIYNYARKALADLRKYLYIILQALQEQSGDPTLAVPEPSEPSKPSKHPDTAEPPYNEESEDSDDEDFGTYQDDTYVETALGNVNGIIDRLYQLSFKIRNPVTRLGFSKAQNYQEIDKDTGLDLIPVIADFDRQHVEHVFLQLQKRNSTEDVRKHYLVKRLAKANTRRRQQFKYWRARRVKIQASSEPAKDSNFLIRSSNVLGTEQQQLLETPMPGQPAPSMPSTATRLDPAIVNLDDTTSIISTSTYAKLTKGPAHDLEIPQLPKKLRGKKEFECPYCHVLCSGRLGSPRLWNQHVLCDLRPYICTYEDCKDADQQFDSFKQWLAHEANDHRLARECVEHPGEIFRSVTDWREHIAAHHIDSPSTKHLETTANDYGISEEDRACPICTDEAVTPEHVGIHLQQLALFALPRSTGLEDDLNPDDAASVATADDLGRDREEDSDMLSLPNEDGRPPEAVYGVDFNDVGNVLADLDPYELASDNRHIDDDWSVIYNPKLPRQLDVELQYSIDLDCYVYCVRFSSDGQYVAIGSSRFAAIYHVETGEKAVELKINDSDVDGNLEVLDICFDSQGDHLSTAARDAVIRVFHIRTRTLKVAITAHTTDSIDFIPETSYLLSGSYDRTVRLWDVQTGAEVLKFQADGLGGMPVSFKASPDGKLLAAGCDNGTAMIWTVNGELLAMLSGTEGHVYVVYDIAFSPDSQEILTASGDSTYKLWDIRALQSGRGGAMSLDAPLRTFTGHKVKDILLWDDILV
ncbi:MAG: hypothetical protein Q9186_007357 [Xanthomendoza sp. 1 TL-2023]